MAVLRVLNCCVHDELRTLRHEILSKAGCEVVSPGTEEALEQIRSQRFDVLVISHPAAEREIDMLCLEFRRRNPAGRVVAIQGASRSSALCEADVTIDAYNPKALVDAVNSYPQAHSKFTRERRLTYSGTGNFIGWSCDRCCWHRQAPGASEDSAAYQRGVQAEFQAHSCEAYARAEWGPSAA